MKKFINGMPLNLTDKLINVDGELFVLSQEEVQLRKQADNLHLEFVMYEALREKNWKKVCSMATDTPWMYKEIFKHFEEMPDEYKVKLAMSAYVDKGDKYSFVAARCAGVPI